MDSEWTIWENLRDVTERDHINGYIQVIPVDILPAGPAAIVGLICARSLALDLPCERATAALPDMSPNGVDRSACA